MVLPNDQRILESCVIDCVLPPIHENKEEARVWTDTLLKTRVGTVLQQWILDAQLSEISSPPFTPVAQAVDAAKDLSSSEIEDLYLIIVALLRLFLQVNCTGPTIATLRPSERILEERRIEVKGLFNNYECGPGSETVMSNTVSYWSVCPYGIPDDRVGESKSRIVDDNMLARLTESLSVDGEILSESIRGVCYLWIPVQLTAVLLQLQSSSVLLRILESRVSFIWQQCLSSGSLNPSPSLMKRATAQLSGILEHADVLSSPVALFHESTGPLFSSSDSCSISAVTESDKIDLSPMDIQWRECVPEKSECRSLIKSLSPDRLGFLLVELSIRLTYFGRHEVGLLVLKTASKVLGFAFSFDSVMGIRREFQTKTFAQLVVKVTPIASTPSNTMPNKLSNNGDIVCADCVSQNDHGSELIRIDDVRSIPMKDLDPSSDILEYTKYTLEDPSVSQPLSVSQLLVLLAYCYSTFKSSPSYDPITLEQLRAIVERCLVPYQNQPRELSASSNLNWLIYSMCLWFRSKAEYHRLKTHDRSLLQMQNLVDLFWSREPEASERLQYVCGISYPMRGDAALTLGHAQMESGGFMTAYEMFKEMWMWEQSAECLIAAGRKSLAKDLLLERLSKRPTSCILCCLGDINDDPSYYEEAWKLSNMRYARAQRSLGKYWFLHKDLEKSADCYEKALKMNPMYDKSWFMLGICQMNLKRYSCALQSFGRVVTLTDENGEAWANLSAVHCQLNSFDEAMVCIMEAVKKNRENWKVWDNYIRISIKLGRWRDVIRGMNEILQLGQNSKLAPWMFGFLTDCALSHESSDDPMVVSIKEFFNTALSCSLPDVTVVLDCYARILASLDDHQTEYEIRWKQFRTILATLPESFDPEFTDSTTAVLLSVTDDILLSHRRWSSDDRTTEQMKADKTEELIKTVSNLKERLGQSKFSNASLLEHLNEMISQIQT